MEVEFSVRIICLEVKEEEEVGGGGKWGGWMRKSRFWNEEGVRG